MIKGQELQNRAVRGPQSDDIAERPILQADRVAMVEERIEAARKITDGENRHCSSHTRYSPCAECFRRGRDAALRIIDGA